jgi:hypothetical protein
MFFAQEWHLAGANFAVYAIICALTYAMGGIDPVALAA